MLAYNHAPHVAQALESVLAQRATFPYEVVVGEDRSTDGTREIVSSFAARHPDRVRVLARDRNLGMHANAAATLSECRGEYVAILDGDDYWTDPEKLQLQVGALDGRPEASLCFHRSLVVDAQGVEAGPPFPDPADAPFDLRHLLRRNFVPSASMMVRRSALPALPPWYQEVGASDWLWNLLCARSGPIVFLPRVMSAYRVHTGGGWSRLDPRPRLRATLPMFRRIERELHGRDRRMAQRMLWTFRAWYAAETLTGGRFQRTYQALRSRLLG
jgi:glycosyltransferase involved in cell wall biosynthesis